jgi:hypothetical protein
MNILFSMHWLLVASLWYFINRVLHDIFILIKHKGDYNRDLLRLLMDGHVLIFSGMILFICYLMCLIKIQSGAAIGLIVAFSILVYCLMIFPFLKSFGTIAISIMVITVCIRAHSMFPDIYNVMHKYK